jgi:hypothetical protein
MATSNTAVRTLFVGGAIKLPLETMTDATAVLGIRGSGKTNTATVIVEEVLQLGQQVVVIDPTDVWWGLKSSADGQRAGFPVVVLGGKHADAPLDTSDGALLADFVVDEGASVVLCTRGFESRAQERRFVTDFCRRLYYRKGQQDNPTPLLVVFDEASRVVPQRVMGEDAQVVGAVQQLVRQGRSSGFGVMLVDQRAATVNKDVLTQCETLIAHRTKGVQDRKALKDWIEQHDTNDKGDEFLNTLASLKQGEAWFWSPGFAKLFKRAQVRLRTTFDSSATPKIGEKRTTPKAFAAVDVDVLRTKLAATIERARENDATELRKRIVELEARHDNDDELNEIRLGEQVRLKEVFDEGYRGGWNNAEQRAYDHAQQELTALHVLASSIERGVGELRVMIEEWKRRPIVLAPSDLTNEQARTAKTRPLHDQSTARVAAPVRVPARDEALAMSSTTSNGSGISDGRFADAFKFLSQMGIPAPTRVQLALWLTYHPRTPSFVAALKSLEDRRLIDVDGAGYVPSAKLLKLGVGVDVLTKREVPSVWRNKIGDKIAADIILQLERNRGRAMTRNTIATALDYHPRTPSFVKALQKLETYTLVTLSSGSVTPTPLLFP